MVSSARRFRRFACMHAVLQHLLHTLLRPLRCVLTGACREREPLHAARLSVAFFAVCCFWSQPRDATVVPRRSPLLFFRDGTPLLFLGVVGWGDTMPAGPWPLVQGMLHASHVVCFEVLSECGLHRSVWVPDALKYIWRRRCKKALAVRDQNLWPRRSVWTLHSLTSECGVHAMRTG